MLLGGAGGAALANMLRMICISPSDMDACGGGDCCVWYARQFPPCRGPVCLGGRRDCVFRVAGCLLRV